MALEWRQDGYVSQDIRAASVVTDDSGEIDFVIEHVGPTDDCWEVLRDEAVFRTGTLTECMSAAEEKHRQDLEDIKQSGSGMVGH